MGVVVLPALIACSPAGDQPTRCAPGAGSGVAVLVSATESDVHPALTARAFEKLGVLAAGGDVTDGPGGKGVPAVVSSADGQFLLDLVQAIADAVAGRDPGLLIIVSHGLSTRGAFDARHLTSALACAALNRADDAASYLTRLSASLR